MRFCIICHICKISRHQQQVHYLAAMSLFCMPSSQQRPRQRHRGNMRLLQGFLEQICMQTAAGPNGQERMYCQSIVQLLLHLTVRGRHQKASGVEPQNSHAFHMLLHAFGWCSPNSTPGSTRLQPVQPALIESPSVQALRRLIYHQVLNPSPWVHADVHCTLLMLRLARCSMATHEHRQTVTPVLWSSRVSCLQGLHIITGCMNEACGTDHPSHA